MKKDISFLVARSLLKASKKGEKEKLAQWKDVSVENASFARAINAYWNLPVEEFPCKNRESARTRLLARIASARHPEPVKPVFSYVLRIAAAVILMVAIGGVAFYEVSKSGLFCRDNLVEVSTEDGQQSKVVLPDGSLVWLNVGTDVKYSAGKDVRKISLSGEAYFEVSHDAERPFIVETGNTKIKVLGTKFNVSHYPGSKLTAASLLTGKIMLSAPGIRREIELHPGQKLVYNEENQACSTATVRVENEILWRQGILVFENEAFNDLVQKLERYYAVKFIYKKNAFENLHYTGTIDNLSINKVLDFINLTIPVNYEIENKTIKLYLS